MTTLKPPLHKGCVCTVEKGERLPEKPEDDIIVIEGQEFSTKMRATKQREHILGTSAYKNRAKQAEKPQSGFYEGTTLGEIDALVRPHMGKHNPEILKSGGAIEFFDDEKPRGKYFERAQNELVDSSRICVRYAQDGWHAYITNAPGKEEQEK